MKKLRRIGCILMCICMFFTNMSMSVYAEEEPIDKNVERVTNVRLEHEDDAYYLKWDVAEGVESVTVMGAGGNYWHCEADNWSLEINWLKAGESQNVSIQPFYNGEYTKPTYYTIEIPLSSSTTDKPASPQNVKAEGGINTIRFSWDAVEGINVYGIFEVVDGTLKHFDDVSTPNPYITCEFSTKKEEHTFVVLSKKDGVYSDYTAEDFITVKYADISNIRHECSEATDYDLQVNWDATGYIADYTIGLKGHEDYTKTLSGSETGFTDTDPAYSETMKFTITVNSFDGSITKEYNVAVPDLKTFQKVTNVRVEYEGGAYYLKWDVTEGVELVTITGADGSHWDRRADSCSLEINWLEAGESESVSIAPFSNGKYGVSTYYKITVPMTPPVTESEDKITNIRLEYEDGTYYLNCDMAEDVDYVDVTVYTDGGHCRIDKESSGLGIAWLKPGETGKVSLCAWMNDAKWDKKSYEYTIAIPLSPSTGDKPASPQNVKIEGGINTIRFSWDAAEGVNVYEIYEVINGKLVSSETVNAPKPYITYTPNDKKEEYTFVILSKKDGVYSDYTADDFITVKHANISNIRHECSEATDYDLEVNWDATGYIADYTIGLKGHEDYTKTVSGSETGFTDTDPAYSETMKFTITVNSFDGSLAKEYNVAVPDLKTFQKVTNVRVEYEGGAYYLKWDVTEGVELVTITGADGSHWDRRADNCSLEINWLEAGETESVSIAPFSNGKYGVSTYYTITIPSTPPKPQNIKVVPGYSSIQITWDKIKDVDGFVVHVVDEKTGKIYGAVASAKGEATSVIYDDFSPSSEERSWKIVVRSHKDGVYSDYTEEDYVVVKPLTAPLKISNLRVNEDESGTAEMTWEVNGPVEYYIITCSDGSCHIWVPGDATSYTFNGGTEGYTIYLDPFGVDGWGKGVSYISKPNYDAYDRITNIRVTNENGEYYLKWKVTNEIESVLVTGEDGSHWTIDSETSALNIGWIKPGKSYSVTLSAYQYDGKYVPKSYRYTITIPEKTSQGDSSSSSSSDVSGSTTQNNSDVAINPTATTSDVPQTSVVLGDAKAASIVSNGSNAAQAETAAEENGNTVTLTLEGADAWDDLIGEIVEITEEKEAADVVVQMKDETVVPADVLDTIKGKDVDVVLEMSDGISWTINGQNVKDAQDIDLGVVLNTDNIPEALLSSVGDGIKSIPLSLVHNGNFGFDAILTIELEDTEDNQYASLFYFDEEKQELTFMEEVLIKDGKALFKFEHASEWLIVVNETSYLDSITTIAKPAVTQDTDAADTAMAEDVTVTGAEVVEISEKSGVNVGLILVIAVVVIVMIGGCGIMLSRKKEIQE